MFDFVQNLCGIQDVRQRGYALVERLNTLEDEEIVSIIKAICDGAAGGSSNFIDLYNALISGSVLRENIEKERLNRLISIAREVEYHDVLIVFLDLPGANNHVYPHQPLLDGSSREMPLGIRKSQARKPDFKLLQRIARDQDFRVIRILLDNPRLTESDVIRIASTRPTSPKVLLEIYINRKWIGRHRIKKALIMNPHTPVLTALRLLTFMALEDLVEVGSRSDLSPLVLSEAGALRRKKEIQQDTYFIDDID